MKWLFFTLLIVNVGLATFQWVKHREHKVEPQYMESVNAKKIVLLSDKYSSGGAASVNQRCVVMGPILDKEVITEIRDKFLKEGEALGLVTQELERAPSYWVYVEQKGVSENIDATIREHGLEGYRIRGGELAGGYSLGVFDNVDLARKLVKKVKKTGLPIQIHKKKRFESSYWLEYGVDYAAENPVKISELAALLSNDVKKREIFCKSVASGK